MENDSVMAVNKIVITDKDNTPVEDAVEADVEEAIQNKLGEIDTNE